jgi:hypothetical protein
MADEIKSLKDVVAEKPEKDQAPSTVMTNWEDLRAQAGKLGITPPCRFGVFLAESSAWYSDRTY